MRLQLITSLLCLATLGMCYVAQAEDELPPIEVRMRKATISKTRAVSYTSPWVEQAETDCIELEVVVTSDMPLILRRRKYTKDPSVMDVTVTTDSEENLHQQDYSYFRPATSRSYRNTSRIAPQDAFDLGRVSMRFDAPDAGVESLRKLSGKLSLDRITEVKTLTIDDPADKVGESFKCDFGSITLESIEGSVVKLQLSDGDGIHRWMGKLTFHAIIEEGQTPMTGDLSRGRGFEHTATMSVGFRKPVTRARKFIVDYPAKTERIIIPFEITDIPLTAEAVAKQAEAAGADEVPAEEVAPEEARPAE